MATKTSSKPSVNSAKLSSTGLLKAKQGMNLWIVAAVVAVVVGGGVTFRLSSHAATLPVGGGGGPYLSCAYTVSPSKPVAGKTFTITATVTNLGSYTGAVSPFRTYATSSSGSDFQYIGGTGRMGAFKAGQTKKVSMSMVVDPKVRVNAMGSIATTPTRLVSTGIEFDINVSQNPALSPSCLKKSWAL